MKLNDYIKDKIISLLLFILVLLIITVLLYVFKTNTFLMISIIAILVSSYCFYFIYDFFKKKFFYDSISKSIDYLDKKYYITEIISKPNFYEGDFLVDYLYQINKSFIEEINKYKYNSEEFKEYIELWCHEIKTPIATSNLIISNNKNKVTESILEEVDKINSLVEQVLFYARSDKVYNDYIINNTDLKEVISNVIKKNKKVILSKKIKIEISNNICNVNSDGKWLEFIINQIVSNSIKYSKDKNSYISFNCIINKNNVALLIKDNGIGISNDELSKVFNKGFTGSNGRKKYNSTGIGLYLVKKLCDKLGHNIEIESVLNEETIVKIVFPNNSLIDPIK